MKQLLILFGGVLLLGACGSSQKTRKGPQEVDPSTAQEVQTHMDYLAADALAGREAGTPGIEAAAVYIENFFKKHGVQPYYPAFRDTLANFEPTAFNVVGYIPGTDPAMEKEAIIIGAHYDHIGMGKPVDGDEIANGANDNATGTTTVLELARYFAQRNNNKRPLIFALFSAEEKGLLGSRHLAARMKKEGLNPYLVLNFEMTGVPMTDKPYRTYLTGYKMSDLAQKMNGYAGEELVGFLPTAKAYNLFMRSDNYPFYEEFQIPAHTFSTFDFTNFDHYHQVGDEVNIMDINHMSALINAMAPSIEQLINDATKVKMVDGDNSSNGM